MKRLHVFISGRVQRVFFRYNTKKKADQIGVSGWVRNLEDGRVEAVFEGTEKQLTQILDFCHKGPFLAKVKNIEIKEERVKNEESFEVVY